MNTTRRKFIATSATAAAGISVSRNVLAAPLISKNPSANDTIRMGFIGVGNRGSQLLNWFRENKDVEIAALCDVYAPYKNRNRSEVDKR